MVISGWGKLHTNALKKTVILRFFFCFFVFLNLLKVQCVVIQHFY